MSEEDIDGIVRKTCGQFLRLWRERDKLTQKTIRITAGLAQSTISRIERGETSPSLEQIESIAAALRVDGAELAATLLGVAKRTRAAIRIKAPRVRVRLHGDGVWLPVAYGLTVDFGESLHREGVIVDA